MARNLVDSFKNKNWNEYLRNNIKAAFNLFVPFIFISRSSKIRFICTAILVLIDCFIVAILPYLTKIIINKHAILDQYSFLLLISVFCIAYSFNKMSSAIAELIFFPVINTAIRDITAKLIKHIHQIEAIKYDQIAIPKVISIIKRIAKSTRFFIKVVSLSIMPNLIKVIIASMILVQLNLKALIWVLFIIICCYWLLTILLKYIISRRKAWLVTDNLAFNIVDNLFNSKMVRFNLKNEHSKIKTLLVEEAKKWNDVNFYSQFFSIAEGMVLAIALASVMMFQGYLLKTDPNITIGDLMMVKSYVITIFIPLRSFLSDIKKIFESSCDIEKLVDIFNIPITRHDYQEISKNNNIQIDNVSFSYKKNRKILHNISLQINYGEKIIIKGQNGAGKSSLCHLICGLYRPEAGSVKIGGIEVSQINPEILGKKLHFIPQNGIILHGSDLQSYIDEYQKLVPDHHIAENYPGLVKNINLSLSGGEKQYILVKRALRLKPEILLLDESTCFMDKHLEEMIINEIVQQVPTVIIVTHKQSLEKFADKIYDLNHL